MFKFRSNLKTSVRILPTGSNIVLICLIATFALSITFLFYLMINNLNYWPMFFVSGTILLTIVVLWLFSHRTIDDSTIPPISVSKSDDAGSTELSIHHRAATNIENIETLVQAFSTLLHRQPLPSADGLIDEKGNPIPNSKDDAQMRVNSANDQVRQDIGSIFSTAIFPENGEDKIQFGQGDKPELEEVKQVNKPGTSSNDN